MDHAFINPSQIVLCLKLIAFSKAHFLKDHKVKISGKGLLLQCCWVAKSGQQFSKGCIKCATIFEVMDGIAIRENYSHSTYIQLPFISNSNKTL